MERNLCKQLEEFLFENNCFSQFCVNLLEQKHLTFEEYIEEHFNKYDYLKEDSVYSWNCFFLNAFTYNISPEGEDFWISIYHKWKKDF